MRFRFVALTLLPLSLAAQAADLTVEVTGLDTARLQGAELMIAAYAEPAQWLRQPVVSKKVALGAEGASGSVTVVLKDVPAGPLALTAYQDVNGNGKLDRNAMGMPVEPYGFSNDAVGSFGPPKFEQAVLKSPTAATVRIRVY